MNARPLATVARTAIALAHSPGSGPDSASASRRQMLRTTARALGAGGTLLAAGLLGGCGFRLRQAPSFAFRTLMATLPATSPLRRELRTALVSAGITVVDASLPPPSPQPGGAVATSAALQLPGDDAGFAAAPTRPTPPVPPPQADAVLDILADQREKSVVGSTAAGQVREFQLRLRFRFKLSTPKGKELIPESEILLQRDISYSESIALSKQEEEAELYRDMQTDVVQQVLRRLAAVRSL